MLAKLDCVPARTVSPEADGHGDPGPVADHPAHRVDVVERHRRHRRRGTGSSRPGTTISRLEPRPSTCCFDLLLRAGADGHERDHGGHPDDDAEHGEHAAQPVGPQRVEGDPPRLGEPHAPSRRVGRRVDDQAVAHDDLAVGAGGDLAVVGDQDDGDAVGVQRLQQGEHRLRRWPCPGCRSARRPAAPTGR